MSTTQLDNPAMMDLISTNFPRRDDVGLAWGRAISSRFFVPKIRGFWPYSLVNSANTARDATPNALDAVNLGAGVTFSLYGITPIAVFDGASYLRVTDAANIKITGALSLICFVNTSAKGTLQGILSKWGAAGNRSYRLYTNATNQFVFSVSSDGTAETTVTSTDEYIQDAWYCLIGEYVPSTSLTIWMNGIKTQNTTSIPAAAFDSTANLLHGSVNAGSFLTGSMALSSIHASALNSALAMLLFDYNRPLFGIRP